jgi:hypothetical protein
MSAEKAPRTILAFLVAPLIVPFVLLLPLPGQDHTPVVDPMRFPTNLFFYAIFALPPAYAVEVLLGIPAWMIFRHYRIRSCLAFGGGGALIGLVFYFAVEASQYVFSPYSRQLRHEYNTSYNPLSNSYFYIAVIGAVASAVLFWIIVFWGRHSETSE